MDFWKRSFLSCTTLLFKGTLLRFYPCDHAWIPFKIRAMDDTHYPMLDIGRTECHLLFKGVHPAIALSPKSQILSNGNHDPA